MSQQIIHCPPTSSMRKQGYYGTTWVLRSGNVAHNVVVYFSTCSPKDQFCKKKGIAQAEQTCTYIVAKSELIRFINNQHSMNGLYVLPTTEQIYQAVIRL